MFDTNRLFEMTDGRKQLMDLIASRLRAAAPAGDVADQAKLADSLKRLFIENVFKLPPNADGPQSMDDSFVHLAKGAIKTALLASGQPNLALVSELSVEASKWILNKFNRCGGNDRSEPPVGPGIAIDPQGRRVIRYFVEESAPNTPNLPPVNGSPFVALGILTTAFDQWEIFLNVDVVRTPTINDANLVVSTKRFGPEVPDAYIALTDIGPPGSVNGGKSLRLAFDGGETFDAATFAACAAHEFGHFLGIRHRDNPQRGQLMNDTLSDVTIPTDQDIQVAKRIGW